MRLLKAIRRSIKHLHRRATSGCVSMLLRAQGCQVGKGCTFFAMPKIVRARGSVIAIADGVTIRSNWSNPLGMGERTVLCTFLPSATLSIGPGVGLSSCFIGSVASVDIGARTLVGPGVYIVDSDFHPCCPTCRSETVGYGGAEPVTVGRECFIGVRAIILKGSRIGDGTTVAAGAVLHACTSEDGSIVAGVPARAVGVAYCHSHSAAGDAE